VSGPAQTSDGDAPARVSDADLLARFQRSKSRPACSETLGFDILALSQDEHWVEIAFTAKPEFTNPTGRVQGGFLAAMLDEALSIAGQIASGMTHIMSTLEMKTNYIAGVKPGRLVARGRVTRLGKSVVFLEGELRDADGKLCATASATALPIEFKRNRGG